MGAWLDQIEKHEIWERLDDAESLLEKISEEAGSDADLVELIARLQHIFEETRRRLDATDHLLLAPQVLTNIAGHLGKVCVNLEQHDGGPKPLTGANNQATGLLTQISQLPAARTSDDAVALGEAASTFKRSVGQHTSHLRKEVADLASVVEAVKGTADSVKADLETQRARFDQVVTETQAQVNKAETQRTEAFQTSLSNAHERFESKLKEFVDESSASLRESKEAHETAVADLKEVAESIESKFEEAKNAWDEAARKQREDTSSTAESALEDLEAQKDKAAELVGIVATTSMAGGYKLIAEQHRTAADRWSMITAGVLGGLLGFMVYAYFKGGDAFTWIGFLKRASVVVTAILLAAYSAQQASRNRTLETRNRRYQLELASVDPFLASLEEGERNEVKKQLADRLFASQVADDPKLETVSAKNLLDVTRDLIKKLPK